jgi:hypothetical protein
MGSALESPTSAYVWCTASDDERRSGSIVYVLQRAVSEEASISSRYHNMLHTTQKHPNAPLIVAIRAQKGRLLRLGDKRFIICRSHAKWWPTCV